MNLNPDLRTEATCPHISLPGSRVQFARAVMQPLADGAARVHAQLVKPPLIEHREQDSSRLQGGLYSKDSFLTQSLAHQWRHI